jgi:hypothetical protein
MLSSKSSQWAHWYYVGRLSEEKILPRSAEKTMAAETIQTNEIPISKKNEVVVKIKVSIPRFDIDSSSPLSLAAGDHRSSQERRGYLLWGSSHKSNAIHDPDRYPRLLVPSTKSQGG